MKIKFILFLLLVFNVINAQKNLIIEGKTFVNTTDIDSWLGVNIPREVPTRLVFKNNSITSANNLGYLLQAGDEGRNENNNNLDGAVITGNKFKWTGTDMKVITHGLFTGHNSNVVAKYNYLDNVPMGIIRKSSNNMSNTGGGVAYNIVKGGTVGIVVKGMSNVNIFNNTLYNDRTPEQTWRPLIHIYTNTDGTNNSVAHGTKIYNNILYTKHQTFAITLDDEECLKGLECDYNIYWSEDGAPRFSINKKTMSFKEWQAMGYDKHSVVVDPMFKDLVNFVPKKKLSYGKNLGPEWEEGLSVNAKWENKDPETTRQKGTWQVGAVIH
ncbi:MAG: hypothetical protein ACM3RX_03050 [Methanococcaceae archaeon]